MKAALLVEPKRVEIREVPAPSPAKGEVLVRIREAGICGTDYALYLGNLSTKFPIIPGHGGFSISQKSKNLDSDTINIKINYHPDKLV